MLKKEFIVQLYWPKKTCSEWVRQMISWIILKMNHSGSFKSFRSWRRLFNRSLYEQRRSFFVFTGVWRPREVAAAAVVVVVVVVVGGPGGPQRGLRHRRARNHRKISRFVFFRKTKTKDRCAASKSVAGFTPSASGVWFKCWVKYFECFLTWSRCRHLFLKNTINQIGPIKIDLFTKVSQ